jgi:hypothetical protein
MYWCLWLIYTRRNWLQWMEDKETPRILKYGNTKTTRIMMATVRYVTAWAGRTKYQAAWFLLNRVYHYIYRFEASLALCILALIFVDTFLSIKITITYSLIDIHYLFSLSSSFILQYHSNVVVDKVAIGQIFLHVWMFPCPYFSPMLQTNSLVTDNIPPSQLEASLQMQTLTTQNTCMSICIDISWHYKMSCNAN